MDNLTHTLIGALAGETAARMSSPDPHGLPESVRRNLLVSFAAIGSNLPDVDLLYSFAGSKLNYLLHHRGHTHTIIGALVLSVLTVALARWWTRRRRLPVSRRDRTWIAGILLLTPLLHVAMDYSNNYGVHPFWPFYNGWFYGDSVFIIEPLLWAACAPLAFTFRTQIARVLVVLALATGIALSWLSGLMPLAIAVAFTSLVLAMLGIGYLAPPRIALAAGITLWAGVTTTFVATGREAARRIDRLAAHYFPQARLVDLVVTPMPANPMCWEAMLVQTENRDVAIRRAMFSVAPSWIAAGQCLGRSLDAAVTAPLEPVNLADTPALKWHGRILTAREQLAGIAATNCEAAAALRFVRVPWIAAIGGKRVLGDLRYDRETALGFAEIELTDASPHCPSYIPPWLPPRHELLEPGRSSGGEQPGSRR